MKYSEITTVDQQFQTIPEHTSLDDFVGTETVPNRSYTLPKNTGRINAARTNRKKKETARRLLRQALRITHWTPKRRQQALNTIYKLRPNRRQVIAHYIAKGDHPAVARKLTENYETLPVVHLTKRDFHVLRDVINGNAEQHRPYIERVLT